MSKKKPTTPRPLPDAPCAIERCAEFRAQVAALDTAAIENCIAQLVSRSSTATRAGIAFNCLRIDALSHNQQIEIARDVLAERLNAAATMVEEAFAEAPVAEVESETEYTPGKSVRAAAEVCRVRQMRAFYAASKRAGLNIEDALGMTWALAKYLGRVVSSRGNLSGGQWAEATVGVEMGIVAW